MNDIYWHGKRSVPSKQLPTPPPTQPRRSYENTLRTKQYQQTDVQYNSQTTTNRPGTSPHIHYPTVSHRSHHNNHGNFPYASSAHGIYHRSTSPVLPSHSNQNQRIDLTNHSHRAQQRYLSRSVSDDYYTTNHPNENYDDDDVINEYGYEEHSSENFNYTFNDKGVSLKKEKKIISCF